MTTCRFAVLQIHGFLIYKLSALWYTPRYGSESVIAAHILADVLGQDEADAKSLILGRQTWKMYKENNLKGRLSSYRELKRMSGKKCGR